MKSLTLYDPVMCCSTGVCGPDIDPLLPKVAGMLSRIQAAGVQVERFNLSQQPIAFAKNTVVRALLEKQGTAALPLLFVDGNLEFQGRYPETPEERADLVRRAIENGSAEP
jgi:hypothetical protein